MRLMLGLGNTPSLLVTVDTPYDPDHFKFWVVNGAWDGTYIEGHVTVWRPWEPFSSLDPVVVLCDNQDRLRGDYQDVFNNFHDTAYKAPEAEPLPDYWDDDIPF